MSVCSPRSALRSSDRMRTPLPGPSLPFFSRIVLELSPARSYNDSVVWYCEVR
jgi:hypothetical protein